MIRNLKAFCQRNFRADGIEIYFIAQPDLNHITRIKDVIFETVEINSMAIERDPGPFIIRMEESQTLMDDLWNAGIRPTDSRDRSDIIKASENCKGCRWLMQIEAGCACFRQDIDNEPCNWDDGSCKNVYPLSPAAKLEYMSIEEAQKRLKTFWKEQDELNNQTVPHVTYVSPWIILGVGILLITIANILAVIVR